VMRDARDTSNFALDRYELMRAAQKDAQPVRSGTLGVNEAPVMPPQLPPGTVAPGNAPTPSLANPLTTPPVIAPPQTPAPRQ
jgi:general secretion pathway protein D